MLLYLVIGGTHDAKPLQLASFVVFLQNFAWSIYPFASHTWSLTIEEWFYLSFPLAFYIYARGTSGRAGLLRKFLQTVLFFLLVPAILRFTQPWWLGYSDARMVVISRLDAIMYGVLFAYLKSDQRRWRMVGRCWPLGLIGLASSVAFLHNPSHWSQAIAFTIIPQSFALTLPLFARLHARKGLVAGVIERVSIWSYSMYLCHMLIYGELMKVAHYETLSPAGQTGIKCLTVVGIVAVSALNYHFFEHPATNLRDRFSRSPRKKQELPLTPVEVAE